MNFETIGTIGSGAVARAVSQRAAAAGHSVLMSNSRGPQSLTEVVSAMGPKVSAATFEEATTADLVLLAVPFVSVPDVGKQLNSWEGRVVVDMTNQFAQFNPYRGFADVSPLTGSEWVAEHLPGATVLKAFNAMFSQYIAADPHHHEGNQTVFFAGDDGAAKTSFAETVGGMGFAPVDLGGLREGGKLMQLGGPLSGKHFIFQG